MKMHVTRGLAALALSAATVLPAWANATLFSSRQDFQQRLGNQVTDDYADPGYGDGFKVMTDDDMSAVRRETQYRATGFANLNIVVSQTYCAGCNGSVLMDFTRTSVGDSRGVFGVGFDFLGSNLVLPYHAFITYGDGTTDDKVLGGWGEFWGLTATQSIATIHFGLEGGLPTQAGYFQIDNLTIGGPAIDVPEPGTSSLAVMALLGAVWLRRRVRA